MSTLFKLLLAFFLLSSVSYAGEYPKTFTQLGTPLYKSLEPMSQYSEIDSLKKEILEYSKNAKETMKLGFELDSSKKKKNVKRYLFELRELQKKYDSFLRLLHNRINEAIDDGDYELFFKFTSYEFDGLLKSRNLREKSMAFYSKNATGKECELLEKTMKRDKLLEETQAYYEEVIQSTYDSNKKSDDSKRKVVIYVKRDDANLYVSFKNRNPYDVTVQVKAIYENILESQNVPKVFVLKAHETRKYATLKMQSEVTSYQYRYRYVMGSKDAVHDDAYLYRLPYALGKSHRVTQGFNGVETHKGRSRYAIDFSMKIGTAIHAVREGVVVKTKSNSNKGGYSREFASQGNYVTIAHKDGTFATYYHLRQAGVSVKIGEKVKRGDLIAYSGNTGYSSGPHLHLAVFSAVSASSTQTIAIKFDSKSGVVNEPIKGKYYKAK